MLFNSYYGALRLGVNLKSNTLLLCGLPDTAVSAFWCAVVRS